MELLVVEDDPTLGKNLQKGLESAGHDVAWMRNGRLGLEAGLTQRFDAMILDVMLPDQGGLEVLRTLRQRGVSTPVLLLTALGSVAQRTGSAN